MKFSFSRGRARGVVVALAMCSAMTCSLMPWVGGGVAEAAPRAWEGTSLSVEVKKSVVAPGKRVRISGEFSGRSRKVVLAKKVKGKWRRVAVRRATGTYVFFPKVTKGKNVFRVRVARKASAQLYGVVSDPVRVQGRRSVGGSSGVPSPNGAGSGPSSTSELSTPAERAAWVREVEREALVLLNRQRGRAGLAITTTDSCLSAFARGHSDLMHTSDIFNHSTSEDMLPFNGGATVATVCDRGRYANRMENLYLGWREGRSPAEMAQLIMDAWNGSQGHRYALLFDGSFESGRNYTAAMGVRFDAGLDRVMATFVISYDRV